MAEAFAYEKNSETSETERFVRIFDKFFDLMNVRSLKEGTHKRKPNLNPYRNDKQSEERLSVSYNYYVGNKICTCMQWLEKDFITYLNEWQESIQQNWKGLGNEDKQRMCISRETLEGLRFTG